MSGDCLVSSSQNKWKQRHTTHIHTEYLRRIRKNGTYESANDTQTESVVDYIQDIQHTYFFPNTERLPKTVSVNSHCESGEKRNIKQKKFTKRKLERLFVHTRDINSKWKRILLSVFSLVFCLQSVCERVKFAKIGSQSGKFGDSDDGKFIEIETDMDSQSTMQQQQQSSAEEPPSGNESMAEIEKQKLYYLERIAKEQEKTNNRLHSIIENQKQEQRNADRMIGTINGNQLA